MYQEPGQQQQELAASGFGSQRRMHASRALPFEATGRPSDRQEYGVSMIGTPSGGNDLGPDGSGFDYEVKRQRLLQGASAAASGMLNPFYQGQPLQTNPQLSSFSLVSNPASIPAAPVFQSSSYYAGAPPTPPAAVSSAYPPHGQQALNAAVPLNSGHPGLNPNYVTNPGFGYSNVDGAGAKPSHMNSGAMYLSSANTNAHYASNSGCAFNPMSSTGYSSPAHMQPFPGTGSSVPISSGTSPYGTGSPLVMPGNMNQHPAGSPPNLPVPTMPFEQRSPYHSHSPPPSFRGSGFNPFPIYSGPFPVVRIRGLPFNCSESDVYEFFGGLDVVDVLLTHKHGRFSGEGYCVFGLPMQVDLALHRNRKNMGQRYIEVFRSKKHEYYLAVAAEVSEEEKVLTGEHAPAFPLKSTIDKEHLEHTGVLKLRGLPFSASKRDVIEFFKDFDLKDENIQFVVHSDGRASGEAFVEFDGPNLSKQAMVRDKMMLGSRYIELFPSSSEEASRITGRHKK